MPMQHTENLFRRYKGQLVSVKTVSGGIYQGKVAEITNDYLALADGNGIEAAEVFLFFQAIESMTPVEVPAR